MGRLKLLSSFGLLLVGGLLYLLFRPRTLLLFCVADALGAASVVDGWRAAVADWHLPAFAVHNLPGGLWAVSYMLIVDALLAGRPWQARLAAVSVIPLAGAASELMQALHLLPGTPDVADAVCYLLPLAIYLSKHQTNINRLWETFSQASKSPSLS